MYVITDNTIHEGETAGRAVRAETPVVGVTIPAEEFRP